MTPGPPPGAAVLLVEDDAATRREVATFLRGHGFRVDEASDGATAWERWTSQRPDLVVLDLGLPDLDGSVLIRRLRRDAMTPILVLSARDREAEKVAALESGADDYVTKPFGAAELLARIRAVLRRAAGPAAEATGTVLVGQLRRASTLMPPLWPGTPRSGHRPPWPGAQGSLRIGPRQGGAPGSRRRAPRRSARPARRTGPRPRSCAGSG